MEADFQKNIYFEKRLNPCPAFPPPPHLLLWRESVGGKINEGS